MKFMAKSYRIRVSEQSLKAVQALRRIEKGEQNDEDLKNLQERLNFGLRTLPINSSEENK